MKALCALAGVGAGIVLAVAAFLVSSALGVPVEIAAVLALLLGMFGGITANGILRHRNDEIDALSAADRPVWTEREFERDLSQHAAWTHGERPWWTEGGQR